MAATKSSSTLQSSASSSAGATTTSSALDLTTAYGAVITAQVTNGGTGPTLPCAPRIDISPDNTNWFVYAQGTAGTTAGATYTFAWDIPIGVMRVRVVFTGHTAQAVTVAAQAEYVTAI